MRSTAKKMPPPLVHYSERSHFLGKGAKEVDTGGTTTLDYSKVTCPICIVGGFGPKCGTCGGRMTGSTMNRGCKRCEKRYPGLELYDYPATPDAKTGTALSRATSALREIMRAKKAQSAKPATRITARAKRS